MSYALQTAGKVELRKNDEEVLDDLYVLFQDEKHWIKGILAKDSQGKSVSVRSDDVCQVCLTGGIARLSRDAAQEDRLSNLVKEFLPGRHQHHHIPSFNDAKKTDIKDVQGVVGAARAHVRHLNGH